MEVVIALIHAMTGLLVALGFVVLVVRLLR
jgi:hypothetical protein